MKKASNYPKGQVGPEKKDVYKRKTALRPTGKSHNGRKS